MIYLILQAFILFWPFTFYGEEKLWVELDSEEPLLSLYLAEMTSSETDWSSEQIKSLWNVLRFDLHFSGYCKVMPKNATKEKIVFEWSKNSPYIDLKKLDSHFLVRPFLKGNKLGIDLVAINGEIQKRIEGIDLTGTLTKDRRIIHALSDKIVKEFFSQNGIATTKILFTIKTSNTSSEVFECDYDGENLRQISQGAGYIVTPAYVPPKAGAKVGSFFFVSYLNGQPKLFYSSLENFAPIRFIPLQGNQLMPAVSKTRDAVAFITDVTGNPDLFLQPIEHTGKPIGKPAQIFSTFKATQGSPTFSPDGKKIAFVSNKDGSPRVYLIDKPSPGASIKNMQAKLLSRNSRESTAPNFSPDGRKIAYTCMTDGVRQIWIYDFDKEKERQITFGTGNKENPSFAPDSLHIVFNSSDAKNSELYIINLNQKEVAKISSGKGLKRFPCWEIIP